MSDSDGRHLVIVGGGSAAFAAALKASELDAKVTLINDGLPIGGTCVNVGCVPSKTLIRAGEALHRANHQPFDGIEGSARVTDFAAVIRQKRELVEELRQAKYLDVISGHENVRVVAGRARFVSPLAVEVNGESIQGTHYLIATGTRPFAPPVSGLETCGYLTNESAFELEALPSSLIVLGARYIGLEIAQMFSRFGTEVTVLQRSSRILPTEGEDLTSALTGYFEDEGMNIVTGVDLQEVGRDDAGVVVRATVQGVAREFRAEHILAATGRAPNTDGLGLEDVGVALDSKGFVAVDEALRTNEPRVCAAGDVIGDPSFVYTAAYEGALAAANALGGEDRARDYTALPWVVFTDPQVAGVGMDEQEAKASGIDAESSILPLSHVPRCIAARDTRGFVKLIRDRASDQLVGARVLAPEGAELLMEVSLAIRHQIPVSELAAAFHPYLTLSESVKLAAIAFGKDVASLSCCAT
jgi:mercuric reductase